MHINIHFDTPSFYFYPFETRFFFDKTTLFSIKSLRLIYTFAKQRIRIEQLFVK